MDTVLSELLIFKLFRAKSATGTVTTPPIVIALDIIEHHRSHHFPTDKALGEDLEVISKMLGHRSTEHTRAYQGITQAKVDALRTKYSTGIKRGTRAWAFLFVQPSSGFS